MNRRILFFVNPISGTGRKSSLHKIIAEKTQALNIPFEILPADKEGKYSYLSEKIKKEKITDVIICGGDGTVNQVAASLLNVEINIGIIPAGSGNGLALAAKIPKQVSKALQIVFNGKSSYVDAFYINEHFSCMLCGIGFDAQIAHDFSTAKKRGLATYVKQSIKNFWKAIPYDFEIIVNDQSFSTEAFFISIANSNQFGNNFTIAPKASLNDGLLDVIVVKKMNKIKMAWSVLQQVRFGEVSESEESNFHEKEILYFQTNELVINNPSLAPLHIDGDPAVSKKKFTITILPAAFKLLQP